MSEWISIDNKTPEEYQEVLITDGDGGYAVAFIGLDGWMITDEMLELRTILSGQKNLKVEDGEITHWMPLPEPPEDA